MTNPTSTPAQQPPINANAAPAATAQRHTTMTMTKNRAVHLAMAGALIVGSIILAKSGLGFFYKILLAGSLIYVGGKLASVSWLKPWNIILRFAGWIVLLSVLLMSGFGQYTTQAVDGAEKLVAAEDGGSFFEASTECKHDEIQIRSAAFFRETAERFGIKKAEAVKSNLDVVMGCEYVLDLRDTPEGFKHELRPGQNGLEGLSSADFINTQYFWTKEGGMPVLKIRVKTIDSGFKSAKKESVRINFYSREVPDSIQTFNEEGKELNLDALK